MAKPRLPYRTTLVNFHLPLEIDEKIGEFAASRGVPRVKIAIEAFNQYFGRDFTKVDAAASRMELDEDL